MTLRPVGMPALVAALLASACGGDLGARQDHFVVRDSAGVRIVENEAPAWSTADTWRVASNPVLVIGELEGSEPYQLHAVEGAHRLSGGRIVVANGGTQELRYFSEEGRFLASVGGRGGGPGEFQMLSRTLVVADTVFAFDLRQRRTSVFGPEGRFVRSFSASVDEYGPMPVLIGRLTSDVWALSVRRIPDANGLIRDSVLYVTLRESDGDSRLIGGFPGDERILETTERDGMRMVGITDAPFGRVSSTALLAGRLAHASTDRFEVVLLDAVGRTESLIRRISTSEPVAADDLRLWQEWSRPANPPPGWEQRMANLPHPETKAAHGPLLSDVSGNLWVAEYTHPRRHPVEWSLFDPDGRWLGQVATPEGLRIMEIGEDYLLGVLRDELGVQYVHLYELIKP